MDTAKLGQPPRRLAVMQTAMLLVLGTETAFFTTLVMSYLFMRGGGSTLTFTPPTALDTAIAAGNTLILVLSALVAWGGNRAIEAGRSQALKRGLLLAFLLGGLFVAGQIFEFRHSGMSLRDFTFGGVFFTLIAFHALHVLAGMVLLGVNLARTHAGDFTARNHVAITAGTWFWYFVTAVWIVLFAVLFLI
jgi:cytochrome c oxidase subunit III